jgi:hypothetical protein
LLSPPVYKYGGREKHEGGNFGEKGVEKKKNENTEKEEKRKKQGKE